jgi:hypothetical protein
MTDQTPVSDLVTRLRSYRAKLAEVGGWDNELVQVPAGGVRPLIEHGEQAAAELERLAALLEQKEARIRQLEKESAKLHERIDYLDAVLRGEQDDAALAAERDRDS